MAMDQSGKVAEAVENYRETLKRRPDLLPALLNLGWLLAATENAKIRDGIEAGKLASRAISLTQEQSVEAFDLLAAAYAERQKFREASDAAKRALHLANAAGRMDMTAQIGKRLELYQAGQPFRRVEQQRN
jgi:tetratricopeptide (TPR) repeat protein